ncbi:MAG TPA: alpha/beta hydrolase [Candidatus Sulfotelmatobacter sp.]|nr:alpha/beta hydrolase [Candidatus Sulfotelmatobacter sp.]
MTSLHGRPLAADPAAVPESLVVTMDTGERLNVLDWGGPGAGLPPLVLVHGLSGTGWIWAPIARRLIGRTRVLAPDLRGHGLSESPRTGYDLESMAFDVLTVVTAAGLGPDGDGRPVVVAGHGFGAQIAGTAAALRPGTVAGLALIDGGWEDVAEATGMDADEMLRSLADPPEVLASMDAYLADRRDYDPPSWDADQERAARAAVDEKYQGRVTPVVRRFALSGAVRAMFEYRPPAVIAAYPGPLLVAVAEAGGADDMAARERRLALEDELRRRAAADLVAATVRRYRGVGHNLMRYRPDELAADLLALLEAASSR